MQSTASAGREGASWGDLRRPFSNVHCLPLATGPSPGRPPELRVHVCGTGPGHTLAHPRSPGASFQGPGWWGRWKLVGAAGGQPGCGQHCLHLPGAAAQPRDSGGRCQHADPSVHMEPTSRDLRGSQNLRALGQHCVRQSRVQSPQEPGLGACTGRGCHRPGVSPARPVSCICQRPAGAAEDPPGMWPQASPMPRSPHQACPQQVVPGPRSRSRRGSGSRERVGRASGPPSHSARGSRGPLMAYLVWRGQSQRLSLTADENWAILALPDKHKTTRVSGVEVGQETQGAFHCTTENAGVKPSSMGSVAQPPPCPEQCPVQTPGHRDAHIRSGRPGWGSGPGRAGTWGAAPSLWGLTPLPMASSSSQPPLPELCMSLPSPRLQSGGPRLRSPAPGNPPNQRSSRCAKPDH